MARVDLPQSRLKARKRRRRYLLGGGALLLCLIVLCGLVWLSWAPFLRVTAIDITGAKTLATSSIETYAQQEISGAYVWMFARNNIFLYPRAEIAAGLLAQYPSLRAADVHAKDFHTVEIALKEREPVALWCPAQNEAPSCYYLDETGLAYAQAPTYSEPIFITYQGTLATSSAPLPRQYLSEEKFQSLVALITALEQKVPGDPIRQVVVDSSGDARAYFQDDFLLIFSTLDDSGDVFDRFSLALQSDPFKGKALSSFEYLDLRFGDKLYYKEK